MARCQEVTSLMIIVVACPAKKQNTPRASHTSKILLIAISLIQDKIKGTILNSYLMMNMIMNMIRSIMKKIRSRLNGSMLMLRV